MTARRDKVAGESITTVRLTGIQAQGLHGVHPHEKVKPQSFVVDLECVVDRGEEMDNLATTVDYGELASRTTSLVAEESYDLIETLAGRIAAMCLAEPRIVAATVTVHKPDIRLCVPVTDIAVTVEKTSRQVVLSLGSNLGDRFAHLQAAVTALSTIPGVRLTDVSRVYETAPVGPMQPDFLNIVVIADSMLGAETLLDHCQAIEQELGRVRTVPQGPRTMDIDLITVGQCVCQSERLTLPHPRAHERAFVLVPWAAVDPDAELVNHGLVAELLVSLGASGVAVIDELMLDRP